MFPYVCICVHMCPVSRVPCPMSCVPCPVPSRLPSCPVHGMPVEGTAPL